MDGTAPFSFQWTDNGVDMPGQTGSTLTMTAIPYTENNHQIRVRVSNPANPTGVTSTAAILTVIRDTTAPTVVKANANEAGTQVIVVYSEPVTDTAVDINNYKINNGAVAISGATRVDASRVTLTTDAMAGGLEYTLTINGVQDTASSPPNTIAANTQVKFRTFIFQLGAVVHKKYLAPVSDSFIGLQGDPRCTEDDASRPLAKARLRHAVFPVQGLG